MKKNTKKIFLSLLAAATIFTSNPSFANNTTLTIPQLIYETTSSENLSSGVVHERIRRFTNEGWWNINVIRIDLNDQYTELKGLFNPDGIPNRDKVSKMVEKSGAIAAVNGDFFNYQPLPSTLGAMISEGEMISSPRSLDQALPTFYISNSNNAGVDYLDRKMVVTNLNNNSQIAISLVNKITTYYDNVVLLNKHWGKESFGNKFNSEMVEVLVIDGVVMDKRIGGQAFSIPQDGSGYVLASKNQILNNLNIGDRLDLELATVPDIDGIKFAIGGGSIVLKNGEISSTDMNVTGNHPRTGIGVNKDSTELILVTIDGRDTSFVGVSQEMFGSILRELGAYNAINLDGGGSTTMAIKPIDEDNATVVNKLSEGSERLVVNAVGVFSNAPVEDLSYLKISTDDNKMFIDTTRSFSVKGFDKNHNPIDLDDSEIELTIEDIEGIITDNKFKATSEGRGKVIATYDDISTSMDIEVLGPVVDLVTNTKNVNVDINSQFNLGNFYGKDKNGIQAKIYLEDIVFNILGDIGTISEGVFYSTDQAKGGAISAMVGNSLENILISVGSQAISVSGFETLDGMSFSGYPEIVTGGLALSNEAHDGAASVALNYDFTIGENTRAAYANFSTNGTNGLSISGFPKKIGLWVKGDGSGTWLRASLKDTNGKEYLVDLKKTVDFTDWQYLMANIPSEAKYPITLEKIYLAETDSIKKPSGQILLDGLSAYYPSSLGNMALPTPSDIKDELQIKKPIAENGFSFIVAAEPKDLNQLVGYDATSMLKSRIMQNKTSVLLNGLSPEFADGLSNYSAISTSNAYTLEKHQDLMFINVNSSKNGIRATDSSQWLKLINDLESINESNIVVFLSTPVFGTNGFTDTLEAELLHEKLLDANKRGKNIFVVQGSSQTDSELIDGIRYIELNNKVLSKAEDIYNISVIEFVVNDSEITYSIDSVYPRPNISIGK